jgi:hypothetical protein
MKDRYLKWVKFRSSEARILVLVAVLVVRPVFAQTKELPLKAHSKTSNDLPLNWTDSEKSIWVRAEPYIGDSLPKLESSIPKLKGLEPALSQERLRLILVRVGEKCVDLLNRTPNVVSREDVITQGRHVVISRQHFGYLLIASRSPIGVLVHEYRTDTRGGGAVEIAGAGPMSQGFASMWVRFSPTNQPESTFRYLGNQEMDNHKTLVVAFAQMPDLVRFPAEFLFGKTRVSVLYQGIAWIDSSDFRIVRMREDLLVPLTDLGLEKFSAEVSFAEVTIAKAASSSWLPWEANVEWEFKGRQCHRYSDFRLYTVKTKILPSTP